MEYVTHSGHCCGISSVYGFDGATVEDLDNVLRRHDTGRDHGTPGNRLLEAVLTDRQLAPNPAEERVHQSVRNAGGWPLVLASRGFVLHTRFRNSNTQRFCNVFHRVMTRESIEPRDLPFSLEGFREPSTPPQRPPEPPEQEQRPAQPAGPIMIPEDWESHPDDIIEFHDGSPMRITGMLRTTGAVCARLVEPIGPNGNEFTRLRDGYTIRRQTPFYYRLITGEYNSRPTSAGSIRMVQQDPVPEQEPIFDAPAPAPTIWSEDFLSPETARIGLSVQYRHRQGIGTARGLHNRTGVITYIDVDSDHVTVRWDNTGNTQRYRMNRFVYQLPDTFRMIEPVPEPEPEPEPAPEREPVISTTTQYYAVRRDGTRAGPFGSERQARDRWSRVREYVRVDTNIVDGEIDEIHETTIVA